MDPPYHAHAFDGALTVIYNQGTKENSGIFSQSQGWLILAEALCGHGERAFTYFMENAPAAQNDKAEIRHLEPYCYGQFTEGRASEHFGRSREYPIGSYDTSPDIFSGSFLLPPGTAG